MNIFASIAGFGAPEVTLIVGFAILLAAAVSIVLFIRKNFLKGYRNEK